jgi:hypothetical protein
MTLVTAEATIALVHDLMRRNGVPETVPWWSRANYEAPHWLGRKVTPFWNVWTWTTRPVDAERGRPPGAPDYVHHVEVTKGTPQVTQVFPRE